MIAPVAIDCDATLHYCDGLSVLVLNCSRRRHRIECRPVQQPALAVDVLLLEPQVPFVEQFPGEVVIAFRRLEWVTQTFAS